MGEILKENNRTSIGGILLGLLLIGAIVYIFVWLIGILLNYIGNLALKLDQIASKLDAVVIVAVISGTVSIIGVIISSIISKIIEYRQNVKRYLYSKKEVPYTEFIEMVYKIQEKIKEGDEYSEEEMLKDVFSFSKKLTLWGSNKVIRKWLQFRSKSAEGNINPKETLFLLEDIIFEIRKDMGQSKRGLKQGDILRFFVNDISEHLPNKRNKN
ncbi:hypothetical protein HMPREF1630_04180 [Anaerococcus lactolyticus S7-1-13]|uniref:Uncharacterized protein n=1 Tax=Anaerococcus lactolyticus S7-1-13 TaxID=1284686 RepID=A0A095X3X4_9FIRM|nr:hypothetical protein HMPREF1630_04180 [Anaerococcus lactolyticus S7-1-13]